MTLATFLPILAVWNIGDAALRLVKRFLEWANTWLPTWSSLDFTTPIASFFDNFPWLLSWIAWLDHYVPMKEGLTLLVVLTGVWLAAHLWAAAVWLVSKLHIAGGGSN